MRINKKLIGLLPVFFALIGALSLQFFIPKNTWICKNGNWVKQGNPAYPAPITGCGQSIVSTATPADVVKTFYDWYLAHEGNPLSDGAYQNNSQLTSTFISEIDKFIQGGPGFDPFLCAQDKPLSLETGNAKIENGIATVVVTQKFSTQNRQIPITLKKYNGQWQIDKINCSDSSPNGSTVTLKTVVVYFSNSIKSGDYNDCRSVYGVERTINPQAPLYEASLSQLFQGPTNAEKALGYSSFFSTKTKNILKSIKVSDTTAYVNLIDIRSLIPSASSSCGSVQFLSSVEETLKHDRKIDTVRFAIEGNPQAFYDWIQIGCDAKINNCDPKPFN